MLLPCPPPRPILSVTLTVLVAGVFLGFTELGLAVGMRTTTALPALGAATVCDDRVFGLVGASGGCSDRDGLLGGASVVVVVGEEGEAVGLCWVLGEGGRG